MNWFKKVLFAIFNIFKPRTAALQTPSNVNVVDPIHEEIEEEIISPKSRIYEEQPASSIPYYPKLVNHLEKDHQQLLRLYTNISDTFEIKQYKLIPNQLNKFKEDLKSHLETENIKFYGYLEQSLKGKTDDFQAMRHFRKEMRTIERTVIKFLDKWITNGIQDNTADEFKQEYSAIGSALVKRIESEEKQLYTLYGRI